MIVFPHGFLTTQAEAPSEAFENTYSVDFDGSNDYVSIGSGFQYSSVSISAWIKFDAISAYKRIIQLGRSGGGTGYGIAVTDSGNQLIGFWSDGSETTMKTSSTVTTGTWYHVTMTFNGTTMKMYLNGSDDSGSAGTGNDTGWASTNDDLEIGRKAGGGQYFTGNIDEVGVWDVALDSDAVTALYNSGSPIDLSSDSGDYDNSSSLQGWWRMGDGANYPIIKNQKYFSQTAVDFDGTNDYVDLGDSDTFSFGDGSTDSAFSISGWCNMIDATDFILVSKDNTSAREYNIRFVSDKIHVYFLDNSAGGYIGRLYNTTVTSYQGQWIHIAITYSGNSASSGIKIYLNGTRVDDTNYEGGSYTAMENTATSLRIGSQQGSGGFFSYGTIDDVSVYSTELSSSDVTDIYNSGYPKDESERSGLVGYWKMGDGDTYPTLTDNSTNSNDGTMTNMASGDFVAAKGAGTMTNMASDDIVEDVPYNIIDTDAKTFASKLSSVGEALNNTEREAVDTLVASLKTAGVWTKMQAIYPFVGGTATAHKFNLADPQDTDAAFRLDFNGGWTHSATGADPNGTNAYADTHFNPHSDLASFTDSHYAVYSRDNESSNTVIMGAYDNTVDLTTITPANTGSTFWDGRFSPATGKIGASLSNTQSLIMMSRTSSTLLTGYHVNSSVGTATSTMATSMDEEIYLSARNSGGITSLYSPREIAFASMGSSMTSSEQSDFYDAVQAFQTTLSRQV